MKLTPKKSGDAAIEAVLGPLGGRVMRVILERGPVSVRDVVTTLSERARAPAYTTVMTIMARLHERGLVERELHGRGFVYRPAADEQATIDELSRRAVDRVLQTYGNAAMRRFAARLSELDPRERDALLRLARSKGDKP